MDFVTDPWTWWIEPFVDSASMRRALFAGLLVVVTTSVVGTWVVLRGMSFLGEALAHGVLPGVAIAFVIGTNTTVGAFVAAAAMMAGIGVIRLRSPLPEDTSIGVLFVGMLALAVVVMSRDNGAYVGDLNAFLFGSVTAIRDADLLRQSIAALVVVTGVALFHRSLLVMTFDVTQAKLLGLRPHLAHSVLLGLLVISIVSSYETVGSLLVVAYLIAPPAAAALLVRRLPMIMATSVGLGAVSVVLGLLISLHHDTSGAATMALVSVVLFLIAVTLAPLRASRAPHTD